MPPEAPPTAGAAAYVNVASAAVRAKPKEQAKLLTRLPIGSELHVQAFAGDFARVELPGGKKKVGFVHRDLLAAAAPTIDGLVAAAARLASQGRDPQGQWTVAPTRSATTPEGLRLQLYRAAMLRRADVVAQLIGKLTRYVFCSGRA